MQFTYHPEHVCCQEMRFVIEDGVLMDVQVAGGCSGNLQGLCRLVTGMPIADIIERLDGVPCRGRASSCPAQLAEGLRRAVASGI